MDISKEYIAMCDHPLIRKNHLYNDGDFFFDDDREEVRVAVFGVVMPCRPDIWLPRQDQIQEMLLPECIRFDLEYSNYAPFIAVWAIKIQSTGESKEMYAAQLVESAEQALLMGYMHEKHGLVWTDGRWVDAE